MNASERAKIRAKVRTLIKAGEKKAADAEGEDRERIEYYRLYKAQEYLVSEAYVENDDPKLQDSFTDLVPDNLCLKKLKSTILQRLHSRNKETRLKAVFDLSKSIYGEWGIADQLSLFHPTTVRELIIAIESESDQKNLCELIGCLSGLHTRGFRWGRIFDAIEIFFSSDSAQLRERAVYATSDMSFDERRWEHILPLLRDCKKKTLLKGFQRHCRRVPEHLRMELIQLWIDKLDKTKNAQKTIAGALYLLATN